MATKVRFNARNWQFFDDVLSPAAGASLWEDCPLHAIRDDPSVGVIYAEDFVKVTPASNTIGGYTGTVATSGTVTLDTAKGLKIDSGAVTAGQGVNLQMNRLPFTVAANKPVWMEGQIRFEGQASLKIQFLFGLAVAQTALITSNAVGTDDKIAFDGVTTTGVIVSDCSLSGTDTTGTGFTVVNNTSFKIGFKATTTAVQFWVNGVLVQTITTNIPTAPLAPAIVVQANATVEPICYVRNLQVVGLY